MNAEQLSLSLDAPATPTGVGGPPPGDRRCEGCGQLLPEGAHATRRYCAKRCKKQAEGHADAERALLAGVTGRPAPCACTPYGLIANGANPTCLLCGRGPV